MAWAVATERYNLNIAGAGAQLVAKPARMPRVERWRGDRALRAPPAGPHGPGRIPLSWHSVRRHRSLARVGHAPQTVYAMAEGGAAGISRGLGVQAWVALKPEPALGPEASGSGHGASPLERGRGLLQLAKHRPAPGTGAKAMGWGSFLQKDAAGPCSACQGTVGHTPNPQPAAG